MRSNAGRQVCVVALSSPFFFCKSSTYSLAVYGALRVNLLNYLDGHRKRRRPKRHGGERSHGTWVVETNPLIIRASYATATLYLCLFYVNISLMLNILIVIFIL